MDPDSQRESKNKAPPKRPLDTDHRHVLVFTTTAEKKRKNAEKHSLDIKHQIAQRLRESRPESLVVHVPVSCSETLPTHVEQKSSSHVVPNLTLSQSSTSSTSPAQPFHNIVHIPTADAQRLAVQALQEKEKNLLASLFTTWVRRHDFSSRICAFKRTAGGADCADGGLASVYCNGCEAFLCLSCDQREHSFIRRSHLRYQQLSHGGQQQVIVSGSLVFNAQCGCGDGQQADSFRSIVVVYLTHRKEAVVWYHKVCPTPFAAQLVSVHLFPGSLDPTVVFHESFVNLVLLLLAKAAMSRTRMVKVFNHLHAQTSAKMDGSKFPSLEKPLLFALRLGLSFDRQKETLSDLCPSLPTHPTCLACFFLDPDGTDPHADKGKIVMIDGISKLANQKRESKEKFYPHKDKLFIPQVLTDAFESQLGDLKEGANNGCSQHSAAEKAQSTRKGQTYESTATFTSTCRHHVPLKFLSMKFGERYAYPILLLLVLSVYINKWSYDICCLLLPGIIKVINTRVKFIAEYAAARGPDFLLKLVQQIILYRESCGLGQPSSSSRTSASHSVDLVEAELTSIKDKPAGVGLLHILAHRWACQILYSLKRLVGFGLTDGEEIERLHALLSPFSTMFRSMRLDAAQEFLSEVVRLMSDDINLRLSRTLLKKRAVAVSRCIHASLTLDKILKAGSGTATVTRETIQSLIREEEGKARELLTERCQRGASPAVEKTAQFRYIDQLETYWNERKTRGQNNSKVRGLDTKLKQLERELNITSRWTTDSAIFVETQARLFTQRRDEAKEKLWHAVCVRASLLVRQRTHSSSHKQLMYIEKAIKKETNKLKLQYAVYVECESAVTSEESAIIESRSALEMVQKTDSEFWSGYTSSSDNKIIIQLYLEILRTKEEVTILQAECNRHVLNLQYLLKCVSKAILKGEALVSGERDHDMAYVYGSVCLLHKRKSLLSPQLDQALKALTFFRQHNSWVEQSSTLTAGLAEIVRDPTWTWADEIPFSVESDSDSSEGEDL